MAKWLDDFLFYLPGFASLPIVIAGMLAVWLAWKLIRSRKKSKAVRGPVEKPGP